MYIIAHSILEDFRAFPETQIADIERLLAADMNPVAVEPYLRSNSTHRHALTGKLHLLCYLHECTSTIANRDSRFGRLFTLSQCVHFLYQVIWLRCLGYASYRFSRHD